MAINKTHTTDQTATNTARKRMMNLLSLDPVNLALISKVLLALGGLALAALSVASLIWEERASTNKEARDSRYRHETGLALTDSAARIKEAEAKVAIANEGLAAASERTKALELKVVEQQERAAKAEMETLEIKKRLEPRQLTSQQVSGAVERLRKIMSGPIVITSAMNDPEAIAFAHQFEAIFKAAGWKEVEQQWVVFAGLPPVGVGMALRSAKEVPPFALGVQQVFKSIGFEILGAEKPSLRQGLMELLVGKKP